MHRFVAAVRSLSFVLVASLAAHAGGRSQTGPAGSWRQYATPEQAGFSSADLEAARSFADSVGSAAVMAVYRGHVLAAWGDPAREFRCHSVRKSFLSALVGIAVEDDAISLDATLVELGVDDTHELGEGEREARLEDLLSARSGVYHPAAYSPASMEANLPKRGAHEPGTFWYYNNWDFNTAGAIYERLTGNDIFEAFERRIAEPIGMQDFDASDGLDVLEPSKSRYPAYTFRMSTRDMARFGQLYLQGGRWDGQQIIPAGWVERSTRAHSDLDEGRGYGYMWWIYEAGSLPDRYEHANRHRAYLARGSGGQAIFVIPGAELVVVHRGDTDNYRGVNGSDVWMVVEKILAARQAEPVPEPSLAALDPAPLHNVRPAPALPEPVAIAPELLAEYVGRYQFAPGVVGEIFMYEGRPFINVPGEGEAELFAMNDSTFFIRAATGITVEIQRDPNGEVTGLVVQMPQGAMQAERLP
ncbi:MAG: serine hydrolase [Gemmatimonadetes bacterium]|uniref:Serine hydrolase n=1 Tax=Candidatus Kutchimonas denitrificans TaxID=3056748 RepID=A0AAE4Z9V6_9BACT|nr:serine hydrolase [Gemmatimonadota bacterium]NIR75949.1 serine hydrolase [Candidatus Kutchimonas denitrificans]NIS02107.1 serine hydrolase [Gemmatimonadota bacterium]NIT67932.1 serine hydrolase [Gemmatimonadota bacterium]NIU53926.1 serine hydrolase [Gemmatimonadota bacterium]